MLFWYTRACEEIRKKTKSLKINVVEIIRKKGALAENQFLISTEKHVFLSRLDSLLKNERNKWNMLSRRIHIFKRLPNVSIPYPYSTANNFKLLIDEQISFKPTVVTNKHVCYMPCHQIKCNTRRRTARLSLPFWNPIFFYTFFLVL